MDIYPRRLFLEISFSHSYHLLNTVHIQFNYYLQNKENNSKVLMDQIIVYYKRALVYYDEIQYKCQPIRIIIEMIKFYDHNISLS